MTTETATACHICGREPWCDFERELDAFGLCPECSNRGAFHGRTEDDIRERIRHSVAELLAILSDEGDSRLTRAPYWVNVYRDDRAWGGPEEGGWWYDCSSLEATYPCASEDEAETLAADLAAGPYSNEGRRDIGSVLSDGVFRVTVNTYPGQSQPRHRPRFE